MDRTRKQVETADGGRHPYEVLVLATGGRARALPHLRADGRQVFLLRTLDDALAAHAALETAKRVLVIGGGWLGLEAAAAVRGRGLEVTLVEAGPRLCGRSAPPALSTYLLDLHRSHGVDVRLDWSGQVTAGPDGITLSKTNEVEVFDLSIVAIGLMARDELAAAAGLSTADGVLTNWSGATADSDVFAIGDVSRVRGPSGAPALRLESWRHAETQGRLAAAAILGAPLPYSEAAWFWSEQFDKLIQIAGLPDEAIPLIDVVPGDNPLWRFGRNQVVETVIGVNRSRELRSYYRTLPGLELEPAPADAFGGRLTSLTD